jgi:hypothetical protein
LKEVVLINQPIFYREADERCCISCSSLFQKVLPVTFYRTPAGKQLFGDFIIGVTFRYQK